MLYHRKPRHGRMSHEAPDWTPHPNSYFITACLADKTQRNLTSPENSNAILTAFKTYNESNKWKCHLVLIMPDHLHALISPSQPINSLIQSLKRYLKRQHDIAFQKDFFEHRIRDESGFHEKRAYILQNPVRKGLCQSPEDWPHKWSG